eukprot:scaffold108090_cov45-Phaeocystis_antarctica.AAC.2
MPPPHGGRTPACAWCVVRGAHDAQGAPGACARARACVVCSVCACACMCYPDTSSVYLDPNPDP